MRIQAWFGLFLAGTLAAATAYAENSPRVEAMGNPTLVVEDETTVLSLFNFGNPAGAVFLPHQNRMDWLGVVSNETQEADFITNSITGASLTNKTSKLMATLDNWQNTGYGGLIYWPSRDGVIQITPLGDYHKAVSAGAPDDVLGSGGGSVRTAWFLAENLSAGASVSCVAGQQKGQDLEFPDPFSNTITPLAAEETLDNTNVQASAGMAWRTASLFDAKDRLDAGLQITGASVASRFQHDFTTLVGAGPTNPNGTASETDYPWNVQLQSVYDYQNALDASLVVGYQQTREFLSTESNVFNDRQTYIASDLENWDYEVSLRVRLPMVREDDLRFGIVFNNRPVGQPYPEGKFTTVDAATGLTQPAIETASSSIGIGMAFVPSEGSLIALEYQVGSTLSQQNGVRLSDSGFTQATVGAQYRMFPGFYLRAGWVDQQVQFQSNPTGSALQTQSAETDSFRFGVGLEQGNLRVDVTAIGARTQHSPLGFEFPDNLQAMGVVTQDSDFVISGLASVSYLF